MKNLNLKKCLLSFFAECTCNKLCNSADQVAIQFVNKDLFQPFSISRIE